jgi:hypothetical protein
MTPPTQRICAMFHPGRVGSTVLASSLESQSLIAAGEIYNGSIYPFGEWWATHDYVEQFRRVHRERLAFNQPYQGRPPERDTDWYLFEYKPFHPGCGAPLRDAVQAFQAAGVSHFISLVRRNHLRRYVSYLISLKSGVWHTTQRDDRPTQVRIDVGHVADYDIGFQGGSLLECLDYYYLEHLPQWHRAFDGVPCLRLEYETHIEQDPDTAYRAVVGFLGLDATRAPMRSPLTRQNAWPLRDLVENFADLERTLRGTRYEPLLDG